MRVKRDRDRVAAILGMELQPSIRYYVEASRVD
jgi:hypothetical protein